MSTERKIPINQPDVRNLQKKLYSDHDTVREFIDHDKSSESDSESDVQESCRIVVPKRRSKHSLDFLLQELVNHQKMYISSQRKVMKLKTEIDTEEVRTRYLKLDLNNAQVLADERKDRLTKMKNVLVSAQIENWIFRGLLLMAVIVYTYKLF